MKKEPRNPSYRNRYKYGFYWQHIKSKGMFLLFITTLIILVVVLAAEISFLLQNLDSVDTKIAAKENLIKSIFPPTIIALGLLLTYYQFRHKNYADRKHNTLLFIERATKENTEKRKLLNECMKFSDRHLQYSKPLGVQEMHSLICIEGKSPRDNGGCEDCQMSDTGRKIRGYIFDLINLYEQIGLGIQTHTFDEKALKEYFDSVIIKNYLFYHKYLAHLRTTHGSEFFGTYFEWIALKWGGKKIKSDLRQQS